MYPTGSSQDPHPSANIKDQITERSNSEKPIGEVSKNATGEYFDRQSYL